MWLILLFGLILNILAFIVIYNLKGYDFFYKMVFFITSIVLISMLSVVAILMDENTTTKQNVSNGICPDYWQQQSSNNVNLCLIPKDGRNVGDLARNGVLDEKVLFHTAGYDRSLGGINFNDPKWSETAGGFLCAKSDWANIHNIWWDGITNTNKCD